VNNRLRGVLAVVSVASLFALAACSSTEASSDDAAVADSDVVTIGVIVPIDNGLVDFGRGIANSVRLAVDEANARDAIAGRRIVVRAIDDSSDPGVGRAAAEELAGDPTVVGVVGTYNSGVAAQVAPVLEAAGITMISPGNTDPGLTVGPDRAQPTRQFANYFRMVATDADQGEVLAGFATEDLGAATVAVVSESKAVSIGLAEDFVASFTAGGGQVADFFTLPEEFADYDLATAAIAVAAANPDLAFLGGEYEVAARLAIALDAAGYDGPLMGGDGMQDTGFVSAAGVSAEGALASSVGVPTSELVAPEFLAAYEAAGFTQPPTNFGPYAYDAANLLIGAVAQALAESPAGVTSTVRQTVGELVAAASFDGITGTVSFDEFGDTRSGVFTVYRVVDRVWAPVVTRRID
jgi:branched-chain amino acid transport system substrate-binding protein